MKRGKGLIVFLTILILTTFSFTHETKKIQEEVSVDWWVVPFFAVDNSGSSIENLKEKDIELYVGKYNIKNFSVFKKSFYITHESNKNENIETQKNYVFLVFDTTLSNRKTVKNALHIAGNIVKSSSLNNYFILMSIEPYKGLIYHAGPTNDKTEILTLLKKRITSKYDKILYQINAKLQNRFSRRSTVFSNDSRNNVELNKNQSINQGDFSRLIIQQIKAIYNSFQENVFLKSLLTLGYGLRVLEDNKFVYFFSSGIKNRKFSGTNNRNHFYNLCKSVTNLINQNGAVLFNINPSGTSEDIISGSGDISLRHLAKLSGGEYLDGKIEEISNRIKIINQSYYEVSFPDSEEFKGDIHEISIIPHIRNIKIFSLRNVSRGKNYHSMNKLEREILVLSILEGGYLAKSKVKLVKPDIVKNVTLNNMISLTIQLPENLVRKEVDIYDVFINKITNDTIIKVNGCNVINSEITIQKQQKEDYEYNCVIIHADSNTVFYIHSNQIEANS